MDHAGDLVAVPGHLPKFRAEIRVLQLLEVLLFALITYSPVILKGLVGGCEDRVEMFGQYRPHFQPGRHGRFRERFREVTQHVGFIPHRLVAAFFKQGDQGFFCSKRVILEYFGQLRRGLRGELARPLFSGYQHKRTEAFPAPYRVQVADAGGKGGCPR